MAEEIAAEREQRLSASVDGERSPAEIQRLSEKILTDIRTRDARDDRPVTDWVNSPENPDLRAYNEFMDKIIERMAVDQAAEQAWREEQRPALAASQARGEWVPDWYLTKEREQIKEMQSATAQITEENVPLHEAYLSGRRDSYNALREDLVAKNPELEKSLPPSVEMDEIQVRQAVQQQKEDRSLELAR
ncbi:MAG: hypothetical protein M3Y50_08590 [Acidobacteriota bacterium]|nr:hypothetical protein [Acidobacteriota bacterium]